MYVNPFSMANERPWIVGNACVAALGCKGESFIEAIEDTERRPQEPAGTFAPPLKRRARPFFGLPCQEIRGPQRAKGIFHLERLQKMAPMRECRQGIRLFARLHSD